MNELKIQKELREFAKKRDWDKFHNLKNIALSKEIALHFKKLFLFR